MILKDIMKRENIINDNINFNNDIVLDKLSFGLEKSILKI